MATHTPSGAQGQSGEEKYLLVGTYTEQDDHGVNLLSFISHRGSFKHLSVASQIENPSFVITNKAGNLVFAVEETEGDRGGKVSSFSLDTQSGQLTKVNSVYTEGDGPCYLSFGPDEKHLLVANYGGGNLSVIPVSENGELESAIQTKQHEGSSVNEERQEAPHVHAAVFHPQKPIVFAADLGTDQVVAYHYDSNKSLPLTPAYTINTEKGVGPRHLVFGQSGKFMYLMHELTGEVGVYKEGTDQYEHLESYPIFEAGFDGEQGGAEIKLSQDEKYLYASNRGDVNQITVFKVLEDGKLETLQHVDVEGENPRNFILSPDGSHLIVANQDTDNLVVFERDMDSGKITATQERMEIPKPVYLFFVP